MAKAAAKAKAGKLAKFGSVAEPKSAPPRDLVSKARGKSVGITIRLAPEEWKRVSEYALNKRTSLQRLVEEGLSRVLVDDGLPAIKRHV